MTTFSCVTRKRDQFQQCFSFYPSVIQLLLYVPRSLTLKNPNSMRRMYVFCIDLRTNSDYFPAQHSLVGLYNLDRVFTSRYELGL